MFEAGCYCIYFQLNMKKNVSNNFKDYGMQKGIDPAPFWEGSEVNYVS